MTSQGRMIATNLIVVAYVAASLIFKGNIAVRLYGLLAMGGISLVISLIYVITNRPLIKRDLYIEAITNMIVVFAVVFVVWRISSNL